MRVKYHRLLRRVARLGMIGLVPLSLSWLIALPPATAQTVSGAYLGSAVSDPNQQSTQPQQQTTQSSNVPSGSPISTTSQTIGPASITSETQQADDTDAQTNLQQRLRLPGTSLLDPKLLRVEKPGEFETWANEVSGRKLKRFGADLLLPTSRDFAVPATTSVPPDYALNIGDTVSVSLTGSVEGSAKFVIDRDGQIYLPNVGSVSLAGVHYRDLKDRISQAIGRKYRGFDVSVSIHKLRGVRVYVTGFANQPGAYTVNSLSTLLNAVFAAGGPSGGGSFRHVFLYRNGHEIVDFDIYQLLRHGDRSRDPLLQNEDVLFIPPVGAQVAVVGSVNEEAIYEALPNETVDDLLKIAGGPTNLADPSRVILYHLADRDARGSVEVKRPQYATTPTEAGDIIQLLPQGSLVRPLENQQVLVRIEGEVVHPGNYYVAPGTPLGTVLAEAGGLSPRAYPFATALYRESARAQQRDNFKQVVDQIETALAVAPINGDRIVDAIERQGQIDAAHAFVAKLKLKEPDGRLVLDITPNARDLPSDFVVENNDHIYVPPVVSTVGVFGAVYRPSTFVLDPSKRIKLRVYIDEAGGGIRGADIQRSFVIRANGAVITRRHGGLDQVALAGDTVFVPIKTQSSSVLSKIRDISSVIFQLGLGAAAVAAIR